MVIMAPENARIFYVEDDESRAETDTEELEEAGHRVVLVATNNEGFEEAFPKLGELGINVAIVDGNLDEDDESGRDGERMAGKIKNQYPDITVIGRSLENPIPSADINCPKIEGLQKLVDTVTKA